MPDFKSDITTSQDVHGRRFFGDGTNLVGFSAGTVPIPADIPQGDAIRAYDFASTVENWAAESGGTVTMSSGRLHLDPSTNTNVIANEPGSSTVLADGEIETVLYLGTATAGIILFRRNAASNNHYGLLIVNNAGANPGVYLISRTAGTDTILAGVDSDYIDAGVGVRVLIRFVGSQIDAYVNGRFCISKKDTSFTTGLIGLLAVDGTVDMDWVRLYNNVNPNKRVGGNGAPASAITYANTASGLVSTNVQSALDEVQNEIMTNLGTRTFIQSGGSAAWDGSGLTYRVSAAVYYINGVRYTSTEKTITLNASDGMYPRYDVIALNTLGNLVKVTGQPSPTPVKPSIVNDTQVEVTTILVAAGSTQPVTLTQSVYAEQDGNDWYVGYNDPSFDGFSTTSPHTGQYSIEITSPQNGQSMVLYPESVGDITQYSYLVMFVKPKEANWNNRYYQFQFTDNNGYPNGNSVNLRSESFGFNNNVAGYQQVIIPLSSFALSSAITIGSLQITALGGNAGANTGLYIDDIRLDSGTPQQAAINCFSRVSVNDGTSYQAQGPSDSFGIKGIGRIGTNMVQGSHSVNIVLKSGVLDLGDVTATVNQSLDFGITTIRFRMIGNVTLNLIGGYAWQPVNLIVEQDGTGGRTLTVNNLTLPTGTPSLTIETAGDKYSVIGIVKSAYMNRYNLAAIQNGYTKT